MARITISIDENPAADFDALIAARGARRGSPDPTSAEPVRGRVRCRPRS